MTRQSARAAAGAISLDADVEEETLMQLARWHRLPVYEAASFMLQRFLYRPEREGRERD
jgi:hypothetical protein